MHINIYNIHIYIVIYIYYVLFTEHICNCVIIESPTKHPHPKNVLHIASPWFSASPERPFPASLALIACASLGHF